jgi:hypothetical protein
VSRGRANIEALGTLNEAVRDADVGRPEVSRFAQSIDRVQALAIPRSRPEDEPLELFHALFQKRLARMARAIRDLARNVLVRQ